MFIHWINRLLTNSVKIISAFKELSFSSRLIQVKVIFPGGEKWILL